MRRSLFLFLLMMCNSLISMNPAVAQQTAGKTACGGVHQLLSVSRQ